MKHNVYIFCEMYTKAERNRIEKEIISLFREGKIKFTSTDFI